MSRGTEKKVSTATGSTTSQPSTPEEQARRQKVDNLFRGLMQTRWPVDLSDDPPGPRPSSE
jgi:hypothetical protein